MSRIFAPGPHPNIPDAAAAVQQLEQLLAEAAELRDRIASACTVGKRLSVQPASPPSRPSSPRTV